MENMEKLSLLISTWLSVSHHQCHFFFKQQSGGAAAMCVCVCVCVCSEAGLLIGGAAVILRPPCNTLIKLHHT